MNLDEMYNKTGEEIFDKLVKEAAGPTALIKFRNTVIGKSPEQLQQLYFLSGEITDCVNLLTNDNDNSPETIRDLITLKNKITSIDLNHFVYDVEEMTKRIQKIDKKLQDIDNHKQTVSTKIEYLAEAKKIISMEIELLRLGIDV